jgi:hypothetical protein
MDVDDGPVLTSQEKTVKKRAEIVAWLERKYSTDTLVQTIRASDGSKQGPMPLDELREWISVVAKMVSLGLTDQSAGRYGGGQTVTKATVAEFLSRREQWIGHCKKANDLLNQKRDNRKVMDWLDCSGKVEMGAKALRDKLKDF